MAAKCFLIDREQQLKSARIRDSLHAWSNDDVKHAKQVHWLAHITAPVIFHQHFIICLFGLLLQSRKMLNNYRNKTLNQFFFFISFHLTCCYLNPVYVQWVTRVVWNVLMDLKPWKWQSFVAMNLALWSTKTTNLSKLQGWLLPTQIIDFGWVITLKPWKIQQKFERCGGEFTFSAPQHKISIYDDEKVDI